MKRRLAGVVLTMLLAVLAAGCGGGGGDDGAAGTGPATTATGPATTATGAATPSDGGDDEDGSNAPPSAEKARFIARADAICTSTESKIRAAAAKLRSDGARSGMLTKDRVAAFFTSASLPAYEGMIRQLSDLAPPPGDKQAIDRFLGSLAKAVSTVKANPKKYASREAADPFAPANERARDYGLKACGS